MSELSHSDLAALLHSRTASIQNHNDKWVLSSPDNNTLLAAAKELIVALEPPENALWRVVFAEEAHAALRAAIRMRLFSTRECKTKQESGSMIEVKKLAEELEAGEQIVARIMRALAAVDIFSPATTTDSIAGEGAYVHTTISIKLAEPIYYNSVIGLDDALPQCIGKLPAYLEHIGYRDAGLTEEGNTLFNYANGTKESLFDWMQDKPEELGRFKKGMRDANAASGVKVVNTLNNLFPEDEDEVDGKDEERVLLVDVGGGRGDVLTKFRAKRPDLRGKIVVQDLPAVVQGLANSDGITYMAHSFFDPQPVKGAHTYHLRHVLHNHSDAACLRILRHIATAMSPSSRVLIFETVLPASGESAMYALMDLKMLMMGGMERTEAHWRRLLSQAGLNVVHVDTGSRQKDHVVGVIEARLA